jgi:hypothetical protein
MWQAYNDNDHWIGSSCVQNFQHMASFVWRNFWKLINIIFSSKSFHKSVFFFCYFEWKIYFESCEKFINIILFVDYIKFDPQIFDCYIYFVLNIFFQFHLLEFDFYINFGLHFYNCYLFFPYNFLIEIFYLSNLVLVLLIVT